MRALKRMMLPAVLVMTATMTACMSRLPVGTEPYVVAGQGGPVVVFDAAFNETRQTWRPIFPAIAAETTVFAFERPGYRANGHVVNPPVTADDGMTTLSEQAQHLHTLLAAAKLSPPYVLVASSFGGVTLMAFAKYYPTEVAGLVFVDARLPHWTEACEAAGAAVGPCVPPRETLPQSAFLLAEVDGFFATEATELARVSELDVPATFIVATRTYYLLDSKERRREREEMQRAWMDFQRASAESMRDSRYVEAVGSGHYVHEDQPELVINEIRNMLARVRTGAWPTP
jgi:pimeloyl-ACP methyl ester carboxylesterase